ncbi:MAG: aminotransferase class I/II-fold pyridoxal phosphate-dependent enzyme [Proteobacteria bacterium]|nr:aminotransferase class I/II-fold pyridoxal phosphate-dependent enzyme [Pseudomonadota bacterium]
MPAGSAPLPPQPSTLPTGGAAESLPRLSRRSALLGAAALLAPLATSRVSAAPAVTAEAPAPRHPSGQIRLDSNENPYGPSPAARRAILASAVEAPRYADDATQELITKLAALQHLERTQIVVGSGSAELLNMAALLASLPGPGGELVAAQPTFEQLPQFAQAVGVATRWVPLDAGHAHDLPAMRAAVTDRTRLVYVCNPNNPTATAVRRDALEAFIRSVPTSVLVLVDEAYIDLVDADGVGSVAALTKECPHLIVLRTFSKIHGLAGMRVGYGMAAPALAQRLRDLQMTYPNIAGLRAAMASLDDHVFYWDTRRALLADRQRVEAALDRLGCAHTRSQGNFVFFDASMPVADFNRAMLAHGLRVGRPFARYEHWSRVTIGTHAEVDRFLDVLPGALGRKA